MHKECVLRKRASSACEILCYYFILIKPICECTLKQSINIMHTIECTNCIYINFIAITDQWIAHSQHSFFQYIRLYFIWWQQCSQSTLLIFIAYFVKKIKIFCTKIIRISVSLFFLCLITIIVYYVYCA